MKVIFSVTYDMSIGVLSLVRHSGMETIAMVLNEFMYPRVWRTLAHRPYLRETRHLSSCARAVALCLHYLTQTLVVLALALTVDAETEYEADITSEGIGWAIVVLVSGYIIVALAVLAAKWKNRRKVCARLARKREET